MAKWVISGVELSSRYERDEEYRVMREAVLAMGPFAGLLKSLFCNSKVGAVYFAVLHEWEPRIARMVAEALELAILRDSPSHCGITVSADDGTLFGDSEREVELYGCEAPSRRPPPP